MASTVLAGVAGADSPIEMGTWGTGILQDHFAQDICDRYVDAVARGGAPDAVIAGLRATCAGELASADVDAVFWLAIAHAQRDSSSLQPDVLRRVTDIVERGTGLAPWTALGGGEVGRRKSVLTRFLRTLQRPSAGSSLLVASAPPPDAPGYGLGDCLAVQLKDGRFGGVVVTRRNEHPSAPSLIVSVVEAIGPAAPDVETFSRLPWRAQAPEAPATKVVKFQVFSEGLARSRRRYRLVCRVDLTRVPEPRVLRLANWGTLWKKLPEALALTA